MNQFTKVAKQVRKKFIEAVVQYNTKEHLKLRTETDTLLIMYNQALAKIEAYETNYTAGICDNCSVPKMINQGDGINEPFNPILVCEKMDMVIEPQPPSEQMTNCDCYDALEVAQRDDGLDALAYQAGKV